jgi:hypothetical protein
MQKLGTLKGNLAPKKQGKFCCCKFSDEFGRKYLVINVNGW